MKTFLFSTVSLLLMLATLASPLIPLLDTELGKTIVVGTAEEESSNKKGDTEIKFDELDAYFKFYLEFTSNQIFENQPKSFLAYLFTSSDYTVEILDPPPRNLV